MSFSLKPAERSNSFFLRGPTLPPVRPHSMELSSGSGTSGLLACARPNPDWNPNGIHWHCTNFDLSTCPTQSFTTEADHLAEPFGAPARRSMDRSAPIQIVTVSRQFRRDDSRQNESGCSLGETLCDWHQTETKRKANQRRSRWPARKRPDSHIRH